MLGLKKAHAGILIVLTNYCFPPVLASIMAQFPDLNPYRWPGWFLAALAATQATAVVFCFTETHSIECANNGLHIRCSSPLGLKLSAQLKSKQIIRFLVSLIIFAQLRTCTVYMYTCLILVCTKYA